MTNLGRISNIVLIVIAAVSIVLIGLLVSNVDPDVTNATMNNWITINLRWVYILFFLALILLVGFAIFQLVTEFQSAKGSLVGIAFIAVIFLIAYLFSSPEYPNFFGWEKFRDDGTITHSIMKVIDTALYSTYIMFILAVGALIYSSVARYFK